MAQRSILITGASSGIGLASAQLMKARGWRVLATARKPEDLDMLTRDVGVEAISLDLADPSSIAACAEKTLALTDGKLDALFNNGAYGQLGAVEDLTPETLRRQIEVNLIGTHDLTRRFIPAMRAQGHGRIVQCSSVLGFVAAPYRAAYCASKFALEALSDGLRYELKATGIRVAIIQPGPIRTRFLDNAFSNFMTTIDYEHSVHREYYLARIAFMKQGGQTLFKLAPETVAWKLVHAAESSRPKRRYMVTTLTYLAAVGKRVLPASVADWMAQRV